MKRDVTLTDVAVWIGAAVLAIIHHGLVMPYAYTLHLQEMGL